MTNGNNNVAVQRFAWRVRQWGQAVGLGHVTVHALIASGRIESELAGGARLIKTQPQEFLDGLAAKPVSSITGEARAAKAQKPTRGRRYRREGAGQPATASQPAE